MVDKINDRDASHAMFGLNEAAPRQAAPSEPTQTPPAGPAQPIYVQPPPSSPWSFSGGQILFLLVVLLLIVSSVNLYLGISTRRRLNETASKQADQLDLLTRRQDSSDERYAQLRGQFEVTSEKLGLTQQELSRARSLASNIQKQQRQAVQQLNAAISQKASAQEVDKVQSEANARFGTLSGDIAGTQKDLDDTKEALLNAKGELTGAIARTHDELVALARRSDREYFEFNLAKKGARQKIGTVLIQLKKTDTKKNLFTVDLYFDDKRTVRKDKAMNEPVYFYVQGASSALELVVNKVGKNSIAGYMSAPKGFLGSTPNVLTARPAA